MILSKALNACLGLDIAKAKLDACLQVGTRAHHAEFDNSPPGLTALRAWCQKHGAPAPATVLEATGRYSELAATTLYAAGWRVHVANPRRIKLVRQAESFRNKFKFNISWTPTSLNRAASLLPELPTLKTKFNYDFASRKAGKSDEKSSADESGITRW